MSAPLRSFLFVPADDAKKLGKVAESQADAVILDLEDSVSAARKAVAREMAGEFLADHAGKTGMPQLWVRVNAFGSGAALADLAAAVTAATAGLVLPKVDGPTDVLRMHHYVEALEEAAGLEHRRIRLMPVATETALSPFRLGDYPSAGIPRMYGLTWGAEDLSAALGASTNLAAGGGWAETYRLVRSLTLMAARAASIEAVETLHVDIRDADGLAESSRQARKEGFSGRIAIHPSQVPVINEAFTPSADEVDFAQRVVEAFTDQVGAVALDGKMLDLPHLRQAQQVLALTEQLRTGDGR